MSTIEVGMTREAAGTVPDLPATYRYGSKGAADARRGVGEPRQASRCAWPREGRPQRESRDASCGLMGPAFPLSDTVPSPGRWADAGEGKGFLEGEVFCLERELIGGCARIGGGAEADSLPTVMLTVTVDGLRSDRGDENERARFFVGRCVLLRACLWWSSSRCR